MSPKRPSLAIDKVRALVSKDCKSYKSCTVTGFPGLTLSSIRMDMCSLSPQAHRETTRGVTPRCPAQTPRRLCYPSLF